ncbi:MAG: carboxy-S-adenosyl-L-methionine synthase CmoA [Candidatus Rifleibacteriota bacterium]
MNQENESRDRIFARKLEELSSFRFDDQVAEVFPDMLQRSIPGYGAIISMIETLTARFAQAESNLYDLGCSLGASSLSMQHGLKVAGCRIIAVDNSAAMIGRCVKNNERFKGSAEVEFICEDISKIEISNASVVVLNFTLQFIAPEKRSELLQRICAGMNPGGILVLSEKVKFANGRVNELLIDIYHAFKKGNGYSDLEISQKRNALENVLIPETVVEHENRLLKAGFSCVQQWFQCFNFMSMLAIK